MRGIAARGLLVLGLGGVIASSGLVGCGEQDVAPGTSIAEGGSAASSGSKVETEDVAAKVAAEASVSGGDAPTNTGSPPGDVRRVFVNGEAVSDVQLAELERRYGLAIVDGRYWYDPASGAAGPEGGPTLTFVVSGLALGGRMAADASRGRTGVFVNGRELPDADLLGLTQLVGPIEPGRYFIDALGNAGREGEPATLNLLALAQAARSAGGGDGWYSQGARAGGNESGGSGYVMGRDASGNVWGASY